MPGDLLCVQIGVFFANFAIHLVWSGSGRDKCPGHLDKNQWIWWKKCFRIFLPPWRCSASTRWSKRLSTSPTRSQGKKFWTIVMGSLTFFSPLYHRNGFIYFPEFCAIVNKKLREEDEEVFRQNMFKVLIDYVDDGRIKGAAVTMTFTSNSTSILSLSNRLISSDLVRHWASSWKIPRQKVVSNSVNFHWISFGWYGWEEPSLTTIFSFRFQFLLQIS